MGASKRQQMASFDDDWPDKIWASIGAVNEGRGAGWLLAAATLAVTGCRPAALERGVTFALVKDQGGGTYIEATVPGVKLTANRGQEEHSFRWATSDETHRPDELLALTKAMMSAPGRRLVVRYDAEAISTRLREVSRSIWPRRKHLVTGYCYRELLSSTAKAAGVPPAELAVAMGHRSAESQGAYAHAGRAGRGGKKPWGAVSGSESVKVERAPMARFKAFTAIKKSKARFAI